MHVALLERLARRKVEVARHLVDGDGPPDVAALALLLLDGAVEALLLALRDARLADERPTLQAVRLPHLFAGVAAGALVGLCAIAAAATGGRIWAGVIGSDSRPHMVTLPVVQRHAGRGQPAAEHRVVHVQVQVAADVHGVQAEPGAGHAGEGDIHVDVELLAARGVHQKFVAGPYFQEQAQLRDEEEEHEGGGDERDDATRQCPREKVLLYLGVRVQPLYLGQQVRHRDRRAPPRHPAALLRPARPAAEPSRLARNNIRLPAAALTAPDCAVKRAQPG
mmetsp:Transcript_83/g.186  ORF Transcript_83/g.186 Transcript_83/m.186 type:complete len:279 (+) Transcript_83:971-1807(+)